MDAILAILLIIFILKHASALFTACEKFVEAFKEAHEEIERTGDYEIHFYDPNAVKGNNH